MKIDNTNIELPISVSLKDAYERYNLSEYADCDNPYESRIPSDKQSEDALKSDYSGRELYEIIQNADDAKASVIEIEFDGQNHLHIRNNGGLPFTNKGILSVLRPHQSPKKELMAGPDAPIGNKGLGIRSLLNWGDGMTIHSNGVKVEFSKAIAQRKWDHILQHSPSLKQLDKTGECPLPILSVPTVSNDDVTGHDNDGGWTTEIEVLCHSDVATDVKSKMQGLKAEVLLFLKNIRKISLKIAGEDGIDLAREDRESETADGIVRAASLLHESGQTFTYRMFRKNVSLTDVSDPGKQESATVEVGYTTDAERHCEYLFSYFLTQIPLNLPCAVHADFQLTISRNGLVRNKFNSRLMKELGSLLIIAAEDRAELIRNKKAQNPLIPIQMLSLEKTVAQTLPEFAETVNNNFDSSKVIPTIDGSFKSFNQGVYHSAGVELDRFASKLSKDSLLNNYIDAAANSALRKINRTPTGLDKLHAELSDLASELSIEECGDLVLKLLKVQKWDIRPSVLRLDTDGMADPEKTLYVLESKDVSDASSQDGNHLTAAPRELGLNILHPYLSKYLQNALDTDPRGLTKELRRLATTSDADFSSVKQVIENKSSKLSRTELIGVLSWLFRRWEKYNNPSSRDSYSAAPECHKFNLFNECGERKPASSLLLQSDNPHYRLDPMYINVIPEESRKAFFIDYLHCPEAMPLEGHDFSNETGYISQILGSDWISYVAKSREQNLALIPCEGFIRDKSAEEILTLILKDARFLKEIQDNRVISYSYYGDKSDIAKLSYSAYWLTRDNGPLSALTNYIIPRNESFDVLNSGIINLELINGFTKDEIYGLLKQLGAKENPMELSFAQLYHVLERQEDASKAQKNYKEIRYLMMDKIKIQGISPEDSDKKILTTVWAKGPDGKLERRPKEDVYYWDNSRLPKRFLDSLWKLCLPSRTGEQSVHDIFGVRLLSDLNLHVCNTEEYDKQLTSQVRDFLKQRYKHFVAISLTGGEYKNDTIKQKASAIRSFLDNFRISPSITYRSERAALKAVEGDVVNDEGRFYICSSLSSIEEALESPQLISNLAKGLCLKLTVGTENELRFIHVIQSPRKSLDFEWDELDETVREDITNAIGLSENERRFWKALNVVLDEADINPETRKGKILSVLPDIVLPQPLTEIKDFTDTDLYNLLSSLDEAGRDALEGLYSLDGFYREQLEREAEKLYSLYRNATFLKTSLIIKTNRNRRTITEWLEKLESFDKEIKEMTASQRNSRFIGLENLSDRFRTDVEDKHPLLTPPIHPEEPAILPQYAAILKRYNVAAGELTYEEQAIGYFEGFESDFETIVKEKVSVIASEEASDSLQEEDKGSISFTKPSDLKGNGTGKGGFTGSQTKERIGKSAEKRVKSYLEAHPERYESVTDVSQRHKHHCDLIYKRKGNPVLRYLEVKSVNGNKIHFTPGEINKGKANPETYDLALVHNDRIRIVPNAFRQDGELLKNLSPSGYETGIDFSKED